ncbi:MAG: trypsin-like serine protease [Rhizobiales bacterium]|nr:trypsin-like serine protease [Hyphomicrobiales bacterium]MBI3674342.1 trypsin-like serine protease [Hyphomicrobiales bacterium]
MIRKSLTALLLAGALLSATAANAQEIFTRKGQVPEVGSGEATRSADMINPGNGLAGSPMMSPAANSPAARETLIQGLAGLKHGRDGKDTVIELAPRLQMLLKTRGQVSPVKPVTGKGKLVQINNTKVSPYASMGMLMSGCSGVLVMKRYVLTAAWCVYDTKTQKFLENLDFVPALNGNDAPVGTIKWKNVWIPKGFQQSADLAYGFALIELEKDVGDQVGWFGFGPVKGSDNLKQLTLTGYPFANVPKNTLWEASCSIDTSQENAYFYRCPGDGKTLVSMLGAPFFIKGAKEGDPGQLLGIHISSQDDKLESWWAMRLSETHTQTILSWANGGAAPPPDQPTDTGTDQGTGDNPQCTCDKGNNG